MACSQDAYYNTDEILSTVVGNKNFNIRDNQMADNLLSYISRNPSEKIMVWADNIHVMIDNSSITKPIAKDFIPMGSYIKKALGEKVYSLATIHANDSLFNSQLRKWSPTPLQANSFESDLKHLGKPYLFISSNQNAMKSVIQTRLLDFVDFTNARLDQLHDGYIFFSAATLPKNEYESATASKRDDASSLANVPNKNLKTTIFKSQVRDKDTNEPVPFATVILKKEKLYRIPDENGKFELPVTNANRTGDDVEISSIGYNTKIVSLDALKDQIYLESQFEEISEVLVTRSLSPKAVLKKAITSKKTNHPSSHFNFSRYSRILISKDDVNEVDLELLTTDYSQGYLSEYITTQRVEQVKWNTAKTDKYRTSSQFFGFRENAIQYSNILHKRKYKKFQLNFVASSDDEDQNYYIIEFKTERNKWNYTNKVYPTKYSGRVYIDRKNFAILRVVENWETALNREEIFKYFKGTQTAKDAFQLTIKEENSVQFSKVIKDGKYYATNFSNRTIIEKLNESLGLHNSIVETNSSLFDHKTDGVEEIEYEHKAKENTRLDRVQYDVHFWNSFYKKGINQN